MNNSLLPPNATKYERALETTINRLTDMRVPLRELWNAQTCPAHLLPWLAWSLSVDRWDSRWSEEIKRKVIDSSVNAHRYKGTMGSVKRAVEALGARLQIEDNYGKPHTAKITAYVNEVLAQGADVISQELMVDLLRILENYAPVRTRFEIEVGAEYCPQIIQAGVVQRSATVQSFIADQHLETAEEGSSITATVAAMRRPSQIHSAIFVTETPDIDENSDALFMHASMLRRPVVIASAAGVVT